MAHGGSDVQASTTESTVHDAALGPTNIKYFLSGWPFRNKFADP